MVVTADLARTLAELSFQINRQIGLLVTRKGEVTVVAVGDHKGLVIPLIDHGRFATTRLSGLRLIHTHLKAEPLSQDDLTDLALLRLDAIVAVTLDEGGMPGPVHMAHLIPENPEGKYWLTTDYGHPSEIDLHFSAFIKALEDEFARIQRSRPIDSRERAILVRVEKDPLQDGKSSLAELSELSRTAGVEIFDRVIQHRPALDPKFLLGKGKLSWLVIRALQLGANLLIFDHELTPAQARSIADVTELKVIDRTQLILDIFAQRALSREGKIQVELAQLKYLLPRLVTKNTAMSRLTGGIGGRGPGETKLEINRRRVRERISHLEKELKSIRKARSQRRLLRKRKGLPVISIIGYTNAGKSTLLNSLTNSAVFTENLLFATLDPKSSRLRFPRDTEAIITDTVGFIRDLPKDLLSAFRSTLEELHEADLLLHVIDVSNPSFEDHIIAVESILQELDLFHKPRINVFNKEDLFTEREALEFLCKRHRAISLSAVNPRTFSPLLDAMESAVAKLGTSERTSPVS